MSENNATPEENSNGASSNKKKFLKFKERPLVRSGNTLYYGDPSGPYVVMMIILGTEEVEKADGTKITIANKLQVQLLSTDLNLSPKDRVLNKSDRKTLFDAMDIGTIWLERALRDHKE